MRQGLADARAWTRVFGPLLPLVQRLVRPPQRRLRPRRDAASCKRKSIAMVVYAGAARARPRLLFTRIPAGLRSGARQAVPDRHRPAAGRRLARPHRGGDPAHERHRPEDAGHRRLGRLPGPVDRRLLGGAERRDRLLRPDAVRGAQVRPSCRSSRSSARSTARSSRSRARACSSCRRPRSTASATPAASSCRCRTARASASRRCTARSGARSARSTATRSRASARRTRPTTSTCRSSTPTSTASAPSRWA